MPPKGKAAKGGKNRRRGKGEGDDKGELVAAEDGQAYAKVTKMLGNGRLMATCFDGKERLCHIRGKMRKKVSAQTVSRPCARKKKLILKLIFLF